MLEILDFQRIELAHAVIFIEILCGFDNLLDFFELCTIKFLIDLFHHIKQQLVGRLLSLTPILRYQPCVIDLLTHHCHPLLLKQFFLSRLHFFQLFIKVDVLDKYGRVNLLRTHIVCLNLSQLVQLLLQLV